MNKMWSPGPVGGVGTTARCGTHAPMASAMPTAKEPPDRIECSPGLRWTRVIVASRVDAGTLLAWFSRSLESGDEVCPGTREWRSGVSSRTGLRHPVWLTVRPYAARFVTTAGRRRAVDRTL